MPIIWIKSLPFLDQSIDKHSIRDFSTWDCCNVYSPQKGLMTVVPGFAAVGDTISGSTAVLGGFDYVTGAGVRTPEMIYAGTLYKLVTATWTSIQAGMNAAAPYSFANFLDRAYMANPNQVIKYNSGGATSDVTSVQVKFLGTLENILFGANVTDSVFGVKPNYVIYAKPGTHQFYADGETYATSTYWGLVDGAITGFKIFKNLVIIFTDDALWVWDVKASLSAGPQRKYAIGCSSNLAIVEIDSMLCWANPDGVYAWSGAGTPYKISKYIQADWNLITDYTGVKMGAVGREVWVYLGASINGYTHNCQVFNIEEKNWCRRDSHKASLFFNLTISSIERLYFGSMDTGNIFQIASGTTFNGSAITSVYKTKDIDFDDESEKTFSKLHFLFTPEASAATMTIAFAVGGTPTYSTPAKDLLLDGTALSEVTKSVTVPAPSKGRCLSIKLGNIHKLKEIGVEFNPMGQMGSKPSA